MEETPKTKSPVERECDDVLASALPQFGDNFVNPAEWRPWGKQIDIAAADLIVGNPTPTGFRASHRPLWELACQR